MTSDDGPVPGTTSGEASADRSDDNRMARRAAVSGFLGTVLEFYDFLLYGTAAALVFGPLFFPSDDPAAGTLAPLATFGVAYLMRPLGAVLFGHYGDRKGRKRVLQAATIVLMGVSPTLTGRLPTYETIGILAPILLVLCRIA
jgi:MFS family permease